MKTKTSKISIPKDLKKLLSNRLFEGDRGISALYAIRGPQIKVITSYESEFEERVLSFFKVEGWDIKDYTIFKGIEGYHKGCLIFEINAIQVQ